MIHLQSDDFQVQLRMVNEPTVIWHVEEILIVDVAVNLSTVGRMRAACPRIVLEVMVAIDAVPRDAPELLVIDIPPLSFPLRVILAFHAVGIEGVAKVENEPYVPKSLHVVQHLLCDSLLASPIVDGFPMGDGVVPPITDHKEGTPPRQPRLFGIKLRFLVVVVAISIGLVMAFSMSLALAMGSASLLVLLGRSRPLADVGTAAAVGARGVLGVVDISAVPAVDAHHPLGAVGVQANGGQRLVGR
mmetsp:Transcript_96781/g.244021  ORF Transcript_96781/g.244021 Transcript_96781/m.244021 type:complete len:245 (+) Transcript_96781:714-1448(+)